LYQFVPTKKWQCKSSGRTQKTTWQQKTAMLEWMEWSPRNFQLITGSVVPGAVVAGSKLKKRDAYKELADYVNQHCGTKWSWTQAETRYKSTKNNL
jgi:hypothetical protein